MIRSFNPNITGGNTVFKRLTTLATSCSFAAAVLAGCGGGGGAGSPSVPSVPTTPAGNQTASASIAFHFTTSTTTPAARTRNYLSRSTAGIGLSWRVNGSGTALPGTLATLKSPLFVSAVSPGLVSKNITCGAAGAGSAGGPGSFDCTLLIPLPVGYDDLQVTTWDAAPATLGANSDGFGGTFGASANDLSTGIISNQLVVQNTTNTIPLPVMNGVVASVSLALAPVNSFVSGQSAPQTTTLRVLAADADGNVIGVSSASDASRYVDNNGAPIAITVNKTESPAPAVGSNGNVTFTAFTNAGNSCTVTSCTFVNAQNQSATVNYNNNQTNSVTFSGTATSTGAPIGVRSAVLGITNSLSGVVPVPGTPAMNLLAPAGTYSVYGITAGAFGDAHLYMVDSVAHTLIQISDGATPSIVKTWNMPSASQYPDVTVGSDGGIWSSEFNVGKLAAYNTVTGIFSEYALPAGAGPAGIITAGTTMYFADFSNKRVGTVTMSSGNNPPVITEGTALANGTAQNPNYMATDGTNVYVTENAGGWVGVFSGGVKASEFQIPGANNLFGVAVANNELWVTEPGAHKVYVTKTSGALLQTITTTNFPEKIMTAADGSVYVAENGGLVGHISSTNGLLTEYSAGIPTSGTTSYYAMAQGPTGHIFLPPYNGSNVVYFTP